MIIADRELAGTIRFAMQATKDLNLSDFRSQQTAIERLGVELGHDVARVLTSKKNESIYEALSLFWNQNGLGEMVITESNPTVIRMNNCYDCKSSRGGVHPAPCTFKRSLLQTVFRDSFGEETSVEELECCKNGGTACVFRLRVGVGSGGNVTGKVRSLLLLQ